MKNRQRWPSWMLTTVALLGRMGLAYGQGEPVSGTSLAPELLLMEKRASVEAPAPHAVPTAITDDRHRSDERAEARQLIIALTTERDRAIPVEVLDEGGRRVRSYVLHARAGRRALALDVSTLACGRYVARIGEAGQVVRFVR